MKINQLKMIIREVVREEIRLGLKEIVGELNQPTQVLNKTETVQEKQYSKNSVLNDVLNETAASDEWKTLGGGKLDSSKMNELVGGSYGDMMNSNSDAPVSVDGQTADFLTKDYRSLMKAVDKKQGK